MKVLIFSHEYPPIGGGAGVVANQLIDHFCEDSAIEQIDLLTRFSHQYNINKRVHNIFMVNIHNIIWPLEYFFYLKKTINLSLYDLIICNDSISIYIAGMLFSSRELEKTVCFLHGSEPEFIYQNNNIQKRLLNLRFFFTEL